MTEYEKVLKELLEKQWEELKRLLSRQRVLDTNARTMKII